MTDPATTLPETARTDADDPARARTERQLQVLGELVELGMEMARAVAAERKEPGADLNVLTRAHARMARAVRLTVMLQAKLGKDLQWADSMADIQARSAATAAAAATDARRRDPTYVHKARVENIVERVAREACGEDEEKLDRLMTEACERLDDEDLYGKVLTRPIGELVALICRDLNLGPDWTRLAEEAWAREEIESGAAGSPFLKTTPERVLPREQRGRWPEGPEGAFRRDTG